MPPKEYGLPCDRNDAPAVAISAGPPAYLVGRLEGNARRDAAEGISQVPVRMS